jgi:serine phosphatase RsbU (regulator of sigma subunit)
MSRIDMRQVGLFAALSDGALREIEATMPIARLADGTVLFEEGARGDSLCVILEGTVEIVKALGTSEEWLVRRLGPGSFVGEIALLEPGGHRSAAVRAVGEVEIASLGRAEFDELLARQPRVAVELVQTLSRRLRETNDATIRDLRAKNRQLEQAFQALQAAQAQIVEKERLERELQLAHDLQQSMLPLELPVLPGFDFAAMMVPAQAVGGDFYDFVDLGRGAVGVVVADVSDKGISAALFMALTRSLIRAEASRDASPPEVLRRVNRHLLDMNKAGMFVTVLYGELHSPSGQFVYARAGHELPLLFDANGESILVPRDRGQPLGVFADPQLDEQCITLPPGGRLALITDGVTDALNMSEEDFGAQRLKAAIRREAGAGAQVVCNGVRQAVKAHEGTAPQFDDFTLVIVSALRQDTR